jgi:ParB-like chromosome segregation protein Spo0J
MVESPAALLAELQSGRPAREAIVIPIAVLMPAYSPRLDGVDMEHAQALAEVDGQVPPILVQSSTMRVIDGMHRLNAARINGADGIAAQLIDCSDEDAFLLAVAANMRHGLPLNLADRRAAAARMIKLRPEASDRWIASAVGLTNKTVAVVRRGDPGAAQMTSRVGHDGRLRPLDATAGRRRAQELLMSDPNASLRQVARGAGISPGTVRDVKAKMRQGIDPALPKKSPNAQPDPVTNFTSILQSLRLDPSLRHTDSGRVLLRWICSSRIVHDDDWQAIVDLIPSHRTTDIIRIAQSCATVWSHLADELNRRNQEDIGGEARG